MNVSVEVCHPQRVDSMFLFQIIAAARIRIHSSSFGSREKPAPIYAGQLISGTLSINTSLHWGDPESKQHEYTLRYDIEERIKDWLVCGRKRGEFIARVSTMNASVLVTPLTRAPYPSIYRTTRPSVCL